MARRRLSPRRSGSGAPSVLPGYSDLGEIGGGAFATVYSATETATGRRVALKILKLDTVHEHLIETFQHEIEALAKVSDHPNIVTLYRPMTTPDGRPVLVLELCKESLGERVRTHGALDPAEAVQVGVKIAGALETAHRNGFLHRDMKPQNILITQFGEAALADFGVAALQASAQATAGVFGFTTLHAAPEILEGQSLSPATDVYGLASTMYQLLTGAAPFTAFENEAPASVILRILRDPVRPLRSDTVPIELSDLLEAALAKDPSFRPATAAEFARALQAVEVIAGWPQTTYVAWGEVAAAPGPGPGPPGPGAGRYGGASTPEPHLYPSAPSVRVASSLSLPPLLPGSAGSPGPSELVPAAPTASSEPAPAGPAPAIPPADLPQVVRSQAPADLAPAVPSQPADLPPVVRSQAPAIPPTPAPPVAAPAGPGVQVPDPAERHVVAPAESGRGQSARPIEPMPTLAPLSPPVSAKGDVPPRPLFVDPDPPSQSAPAPRRQESEYERTAAPRLTQAAGLERSREPEPERTGIVFRIVGDAPPLAVAGVIVAALIVITAIVLIVGVM